MGISLQRLEQKKLALGIHKLAAAGLDVERWLAMCDADEMAMKRLVAAWPSSQQSFVYDAKSVCDILGFPNNCTEATPKAADGEVVVWYGGWSLDRLKETQRIQLHSLFSVMQRDTSRVAPAGYYYSRIPMPESNRMTWDEPGKDGLLRVYVIDLPAPVAATLLTVHLDITGEDLFKGNFIVGINRDQPDFASKGVFLVYNGCVEMDGCKAPRKSTYNYVFLKAGRKSPTLPARP